MIIQKAQGKYCLARVKLDGNSIQKLSSLPGFKKWVGRDLLFDRGGADSYYHRPRKPHKIISSTEEVTGRQFFETINDLTPEEVEAYNAGYDENEELGHKKDWG